MSNHGLAIIVPRMGAGISTPAVLRHGAMKHGTGRSLIHKSFTIAAHRPLAFGAFVLPVINLSPHTHG